MSWAGGALWELELARGWRGSNDPECLTLTASDDGALQLSAATKAAGEITIDELKDFYGSKTREDQPIHEVSFGAFRGVTTQMLENGTIWHKFWLAHGNLMIFATYNGTEAAWARESNDVHVMLRTLRVRVAASQRAS